MMIKIYYAGFSLVRERGDYPLSEYRKTQLIRMRPPYARRAAIGAELLLSHALSEACPNVTLPPDIITNEHGKPYLRAGEVKFSLSHSGRLVAVALCDEEIGLDIQEKAEYNPKLAARFFTDDEQAYIEQSADKGAAFTEIWSKKESYIKAIGTGLSTPLNSFSVMDKSGFYYTPLDGYALSVCVPGMNEPQIEFIKRVEIV